MDSDPLKVEDEDHSGLDDRDPTRVKELRDRRSSALEDVDIGGA